MRLWTVVAFALGCSRVVEEPRVGGVTGDAFDADSDADPSEAADSFDLPETGDTAVVDTVVVDAAETPVDAVEAPFIVASIPSPRAIAVGAGYVFVTSLPLDTLDAALYRAPASGGAGVRIGSATWPTYVAVDATHVYWTDLQRYAADRSAEPLSGAVRRVPIAGGLSETLAKGLDRPNSCALFDGKIYFAHGYPKGAVLGVPIAGGTSTTVATVDTMPFYTAANTSTVCWARREAPGAVQCAPRAGGGVTTLVNEPANYVAIDETYAFYSPAGALKRVALKGSGPTTLLEEGRRCGELAIDASNVYALCGRDVVRVSKGGGAATTLYTGTSEAIGLEGIAVDATHVYWTSPMDNTVKRLAK